MPPYQGKNPRYSDKQTQPGAEQRIIEGILKGIVWLIMLPFRGFSGGSGGAGSGTGKGRVKTVPAAQAAEITSHWEQSVIARRYDAAAWPLVISEGDKLVDTALRAVEAPGSTMAERLKAVQYRMNDATYQNLWNAHKVRNQLAHELGTAVDKATVDQCVSAFRQALLELGVRV
jgi:hypothetical protein